MTKSYLKKTALWALAVLVIPLFGDLFIKGWHWRWNDFVFAWVFFVIFGLTIKSATSKIKDRSIKLAVGALVIVIFVGIWIMLATG